MKQQWITSDMPTDVLLDIRGLTVAFPEGDAEWRVVVEDVSLRVGDGERVGLVGESGSGKSMTALACLGLVPEPGRITGGTVTVAGRDVALLPTSELRRMRGGELGLILQEASSALNPVYTVGYQIAEAVAAHRKVDRKLARTHALELLADAALDNGEAIARAYPHELSGGQTQRVMLALALAGRPRCLIADEPTSALDLATQAKVLDLLDRLVDSKGLGLLLISHDLVVVEGVVDRVAVMYAGRIVEESATDDLFSSPLHPYTTMLLASAPGRRRHTAVTAWRASGPASSPIATGCRFNDRCPMAIESCRLEEPPLIDLGSGRRLRCPVILDAKSEGRDDAP
jgi:oligopeptide transport system ATP-binding protein